ncbi:MAG: hypothetical protein V3T23_03155 [Nitrososphaerales archaeon]
MVYSIVWDNTTPVGSSTNANTIDTELQNLKTSIQERMNNLTKNTWETDANDPKTLDPTAMGTGAFPAAVTLPIAGLTGTPQVAHVFNSTEPSVLTGTPLILPWNSETLDTGSFHDNSTNNSRLTITDAGYYRIAFTIQVLSGAAAAPIQYNLELFKNGSTLGLTADEHPDATADITRYRSVIVLAAAADYYEVRFSQSSGNTWTVRSGTHLSYFEIEKLNGTT